MLPATTCASPAAHSNTAAWKTSVPTTRCGVSWKTRMSARPISAPLPTDVTPRMNPSTAPRPTATAFVRPSRVTAWRSRSSNLGRNSARPSVTAEVSNRAAATPHSRPVSCSAATWSTRITPATDAGTLPNASHTDTPMSTVPLRKWRQPPTVLVSAPYAMSVPTATIGWVPMNNSSSGVISDPPPIPVSPMRTPTPRPKTTISGSTNASGGVQTALDLVGPGPPALAVGTGTRARLAADRGIPAIVQRVIRKVVLVDVAPYVALPPIGERSGLPQAVLDVPS